MDRLERLDIGRRQENSGGVCTLQPFLRSRAMWFPWVSILMWVLIGVAGMLATSALIDVNRYSRHCPKCNVQLGEEVLEKTQPCYRDQKPREVHGGSWGPTYYKATSLCPNCGYKKIRK